MLKKVQVVLRVEDTANIVTVLNEIIRVKEKINQRREKDLMKKIKKKVIIV